MRAWLKYRSTEPAPATARIPGVAAAGLVMMLITPFTAFAPQSVPPGPRTTSIRSTSSSITSCTSQKTPEKSGVYTLRPSISTSSLLANWLLKPRAVIAHLLPSICATWRPGTMRRASGIEVAPERRMSSPVRTVTAAGASATLCARFETEVTSTSRRSSMLIAPRSVTASLVAAAAAGGSRSSAAHHAGQRPRRRAERGVTGLPPIVPSIAVIETVGPLVAVGSVAAGPLAMSRRDPGGAFDALCRQEREAA
jgi:hypothetical protein